MKKKLESIGTFREEDIVFSEIKDNQLQDLQNTEIKTLYQGMGNFIAEDFDIDQ